MARLLSMLLLVTMMSPLLAALPGPGQGFGAGLPACCRRDGKHHCMMSMGERRQMQTRDPRFRSPLERCPYCPAAVGRVHGNGWTGPSTAEAVFAALVSHPGGTPQIESKRRISRDRSRQKRGPPLQILFA